MSAGVVAFAFGTPVKIRANVMLAAIAQQKALARNIPLYTQWDIASSVRTVDCTTIAQDAEPPPTLRIARGAMDWARKRGITQVWVVAAVPHMERVMRDLRIARSEQRVPVVLRRVQECYGLRYAHWFFNDSTQLRTRSKCFWAAREAVLRDTWELSPWLYKRLTG